MDWLMALKDLVNPETIVKGGLVLLLFIIFAETGLFFGFFLPGDSLLFVSGLFVGTGDLTLTGGVGFDLGLIIILVTAAAILGNFTGYYFGYITGPRLFKRDDSLIFKKKYLEMTQSFYDRYGKAALILGRFLPIVRTFVPILAGAIRLNFGRFSAYNIIGAALWVPTFIILGFWLGNYTWVRHNLEKIVIALIVVTIIPVIRTYFREKRRHADGEKAKADADAKVKEKEQVDA
jgi:membrane-associated protein